MEGAAIRVILSNPQHGWNKESTPSESLADTPEMSGSHQHELHKVDYIIDGRLLNLENIKEDLFDLMHVHWSNNIGFKTKLRNCIKFKQDINVEE